MIQHISPRNVLPHERVDKTHKEKLKKTIQVDGYIKKPILVEKETGVILDGHHRHKVALELNLLTIPAVLISHEEVTLSFWRKNSKYSKQQIIDLAKAKKLLPPKTTRYRLKVTP